MKKILLLSAALAFTATGAFAAAPPKMTPPTAEQKAEFTRECLRNSGNNSTLCTCKTAQLDKLVDTEFMKVILATMNGKSLPVDDSKAYGTYVSRSNSVCAPGM